MPKKAPRINKRRSSSKEAAAMDEAFRSATRKARQEAFKVTKTIMVEKDGWLVMINSSGRVVKRVKELAKVG